MIINLCQYTSNEANAFGNTTGNQQDGRVINAAALQTLRNSRKLSSDLIAPADEPLSTQVAIDRAADPIKSLDDINRISDFLIEEGRYRDNMLFIVGINFGLRCSDLRMLRFGDLITDSFMFKDTFPVFEIKTRNTRKRKKNRYITINDAVVDAVTLYLEHTPNVSLSDYMFKSESSNAEGNEPLTIQAINRMLKKLAKDLEIDINMSSHTLRKTFCYWMMVQGNNDTRRLYMLQKMLNHSSPSQTLAYIGLDGEEIAQAYRELNIGLRSGKHFPIMMQFTESDFSENEFSKGNAVIG